MRAGPSAPTPPTLILPALACCAARAAGAARYVKCQFSDPYPEFIVSKTIHGVPWSYPENLEAIALLDPEL